jgi:hypothetical protein
MILEPGKGPGEPGGLASGRRQGIKTLENSGSFVKKTDFLFLSAWRGKTVKRV